MSITAILDLSYGDCAKSKMSDFLCKDYDIVCRFNGSSNCGHTMVYNNNKYLTRLIPSGILHPDKKLIIAQGVLLDVEVFLNEVEQFKEFNVLERLMVSNKCHLLLPYHKFADVENEKATENKIGSTKNGVAFCAQDKVGRRGIRVIDIISDNTKKYKPKDWDLAYKVIDNIKFWNLGTEDALIDKTFKLITDFVNLNKRYNFCCDTSAFINEQLKTSNILAESAQGHYLDLENGFFPYVTSVPCTAAGVCLGMNIAPKNLTKVIGLTKAYTTRVGSGPFATELFDEAADLIRKNGNEFGSVTKRPRRVGWLNLDELEVACQINGVDELAITKVDVLYGINPIKVLLNNEYIKMPGWNSKDDINLYNYISLIKETCKVPVKYISYGPDRNDTIIW